MSTTSLDGIQVDNSFHFHGPLLYTGGYGADEALQLATAVHIADGTPAAAPPPALQVATGYLLDGIQHAVRVTGGCQRRV